MSSEPTEPTARDGVRLLPEPQVEQLQGERRSDSLPANLRSMPGSAWVLFAGTFVNRLGTFVLPFMTIYLTRRGFSAPQAGLAVGSYSLGGVIAQSFAGLMADRIGRRNTIAFSMLSAGGLTLLLWRAETLVLIYPLMFAVGCCADLHRPASAALIADLVPSEQRVTAFTLHRSAINLGWAAGLSIGGFLADRSFAYLFLGDAATSIVFAVISLGALPHGTRTGRREEAELPTARSSILGDRGFLLFLLAGLLTAAIYAQNITSMPLHLVDAGLSASTYGLLQALNGAIIVVAELPVIAWTQRHDRLRMVALGSLLIGVAFASLLFAEALAPLIAMVGLWTLGEMIAAPVASAIAADRAPPHAHGRYQSAHGSMFSLGMLLGPIVGTFLYSVNPSALWVTCGITGFISASLTLLARRYPASAPR